MSEAIQHLKAKGNFIFDSEVEAVQIAILLHDIGHGPFSHVLENTLIKDFTHEEISLMLMERINRDLKGQITLAIQIFKDEYPKKFLHQLVSGQLDMDRLDYLRRDSFFTGVSEGNIGSARIIKMLDVKDDHLVVESKGIYSIENFLTSRRLMYWQVYLHKTSVTLEKMLVNALMRAKELANQGKELFASPALRYFLYNDICKEDFYTKSELILSTLSKGIINRNLFKVEVSSTPIPKEKKADIISNICKALSISKKDARYFLASSSLENNMYKKEDDSIEILYKDGTTKDISQASDMLNISLLSRKIKKYYTCYYRFENVKY